MVLALLHFKPTYSPAKRHHQLELKVDGNRFCLAPPAMFQALGQAPLGSCIEPEPGSGPSLPCSPPHSIPEFLRPPNAPTPICSPKPLLGLSGTPRSPSRAGLSPLSRVSTVCPRPRATRLTMDPALMTSAPLRVPKCTRDRFPASQPWDPRLCVSPQAPVPSSCPPAQLSPPMRRLLRLWGGSLQGAPTLLCSCPPHTLFSTPQAWVPGPSPHQSGISKPPAGPQKL